MRWTDIAGILVCLVLVAGLAVGIGCSTAGGQGGMLGFGADTPSAGGTSSVSLSEQRARWKSRHERVMQDSAATTTNIPASSRSRYTAPGRSRRWKHIVVHHSATSQGNMALFDRIHRSKGWDGVGYHFVINNGRGARDGLVEIGPRWKSQKHGAHTGKTPGNEYNEVGIGICLVGNFMKTMPTPSQLLAMNNLIEQLMAEHRIPASRVIAHRDAPRAKTSCCGDQLDRYLDRRYGIGRSTLARR